MWGYNTTLLTYTPYHYYNTLFLTITTNFHNTLLVFLTTLTSSLSQHSLPHPHNTLFLILYSDSFLAYSETPSTTYLSVYPKTSWNSRIQQNTTPKAQINTFKCVAPDFVCVMQEVLFEKESETQWRLLMEDTKDSVEEFWVYTVRVLASSKKVISK